MKTYSVLTDVVGGLLHDVRLEQVVGQHEGTCLHRVQQQRGRVELLAGGQTPPGQLGPRLQQVVHRLHHGLGQRGKRSG